MGNPSGILKALKAQKAKEGEVEDEVRGRAITVEETGTMEAEKVEEAVNDGRTCAFFCNVNFFVMHWAKRACFCCCCCLFVCLFVCRLLFVVCCLLLLCPISCCFLCF